MLQDYDSKEERYSVDKCTIKKRRLEDRVEEINNDTLEKLKDYFKPSKNRKNWFRKERKWGKELLDHHYEKAIGKLSLSKLKRRAKYWIMLKIPKKKFQISMLHNACRQRNRR